jgi:dipeptidyl aminopeptidase/acylaminoacyl peptidase
MTARLDIDRSVGDWLAADASALGSRDVLAAALDRVATTPQERHLAQHLLGDRLGRRAPVRVALAVGLLAIAMLGVAAVVGTARRTPPDPRPTGNGWIVLTADPGGGDDLTGNDLDRGRPFDIYLARPGQSPHRLLASDRISEACPSFSPDGTRLAFVAADTSSITPTPPPVPIGTTVTPMTPEAPATAPDGAILPLAIGIETIDRDGALSGDSVRIPVQEISSCPEWSPAGDRLAYATPVDGLSLWSVDLAGRAALLASGVAVPDDVNATTISAAFDWAPDGSSVAILDGVDVRIIDVSGGAARTVPGHGARTIAWSPDGSMIGLASGNAIRVIRPDGTLVADIDTAVGQTDAVAFAWSPDGAWISWSDAGTIRRSTPDGARRESRAFDLSALVGLPSAEIPTPGIVTWSPDSEFVLISTGAPDVPAGLYAVPWDPARPPVILVRPTLAVRGSGVDWQAVP